MKSFCLITLACATTALFSCNETKKSDEVKTDKDTTASVENKAMIPEATCYISASGKDTVNLKVEVFPNVVTGKLMYNLYQKDKNTGEINGKMNGDTLLADYTFMSEGKSSVREVVFLVKDGIATEGYGSMEEKDGKMVFKNKSDIGFSKGIVLKKTNCSIK